MAEEFCSLTLATADTAQVALYLASVLLTGRSTLNTYTELPLSAWEAIAGRLSPIHHSLMRQGIDKISPVLILHDLARRLVISGKNRKRKEKSNKRESFNKAKTCKFEP